MTEPDMQELFAQAQKMQTQLQEAQAAIMASTVVGEAGQGLVSVTMDGSGTVTNVTIDRQVVDPEDVDTLQDLIVGALQDAHNKMAALAEEKMGPLQQGFGGDALGQMFG